MHDLEDLSNRLLRIVSGQMGTAAQLGLRKDTILIARNLGPAELLEYDRRRLKGVVLEEGSLTAPVPIVARALGVRSDERRVGEEWVSTWLCGWVPTHEKKKRKR